MKQKPPPAKAPKVDWPKPTATMSEAPQLFRYLNFMLAFAAPQDSEKDLLARFARIGIAPGAAVQVQPADAPSSARPWKMASAMPAPNLPRSKRTRSTPTKSPAVISSAAAITSKTTTCTATPVPTWASSATPPKRRRTSVISSTSDGKPANGARHSYTLHFAKGELPPADAFWSLTLYDAKTKLLVPNHKNRYLINSRMLPDLKLDADGGLTLACSTTAPAKPNRAIGCRPRPARSTAVLRIYLPKPEVASGQWKMPPLTPVNAKQ